jgi:hypothetical protein
VKPMARASRHPAVLSGSIRFACFDRSPPNFLEIMHADFHYLVIGRFATEFKLPQVAGRLPLNDQVSASTCRGGTANARAHAGVERRLQPNASPVAVSNRHKKDLCKGPRFC